VQWPADDDEREQQHACEGDQGDGGLEVLRQDEVGVVPDEDEQAFVDQPAEQDPMARTEFSAAVY
jgi:hypothetical protein